MAGRSQHGDNPSSYFSADLGRSGVYDSVNGTPFNFSQRGDNPNDLRNTEGISETARESGLYASRIGSIKQPIEDYSKETLGSTDNFHRQNWDQSFEEGNRTPESGTYSRNIESQQHGMDYKENDDITRSSTFDNTRDSGLYSRNIGSFRETIPDKDVATPFPENSGLDNQRQSSKKFKPNKYTGNTLETMLEGEDESKQPDHYHSTFFSESRKVSDTRRNTDYDGHSNASFQDDKEIPTWTDMMFDRQFTDEYIKKKWPKITLPLSNTRKNDPFVPGIVHEGSITIDENSGTHDHKVRNTLCVIGLGTLLLCLVGAAIITIALLADQRTDKTDYVKVNMTVAINRTFTPELNDTESTEYKTFATEFCSEMENVYASKSSSIDGYYGCKVIQLTDGSIIVNYVIYFISTANQQVTTDTVSTTLITHLTVSDTKLGSLVVITSTIIVHEVATETLPSPPAVEKIATTTTTISTIETTTKENVPSTETTPASETVQQTEATTLKTMQSTTETTSLTISSTKETTSNSQQQSTTEITTTFNSSTEETTPKTMQSTTETTTPLITSPGKTTPQTMQSTTETTTPSISSTGETTPNSMQSTTEIATPSITSTGETTQKTVQSTTETTTPSMSSTEETTLKTMQSTTETSTPSILSTDETTPKNIQSTTETTTPSISSTEITTPKSIQSTTETITPSIPPTKETTPKSMQSKTSTPSISSTEEIPQKTMQTTKETTISSISTTLEPMSSPSIYQVSEETTTQQTFTTTDGTSTTTEESIQTETSTTHENISNKNTMITTPVKVTSPSIASTLKEIPKLSTTYKTPEITTSSVTTKPADESTTSVATMLNDKTTTASITQATTKTVTVTDYVTPTVTDVTTRTPHIPFLSETTSPASSAKTEVQSTFTQNKETTTFVALTDQTNASVKVSTMDETTSRSTALSEDMTSATSEDETTVSRSRIYTSSDKKSSVKITTSEVPSSKETTATLDNVPSTTPAYDPSSDGTSTLLTPTSVELNCTDAAEADMYSGPVTMECTVKKSEEFEYIGIYHGNGFDNTIYGVLVYKNGTIFKTYKEHQDISISIESTSTIKLMITFINVTCTMDGSYKVALIRNISGEMNEVIGRNVLLKIRRTAGKPKLTLSADQVIDLVFPDGNYYRGSGTHTCEGLIGEPPARLEIDITYDNGTSFYQISNSSIDVSRTNTSDECSFKETLSFGLKFSAEMDGARLRCRVSDSNNDFTLSDELSLIPRNICNCGVSERFRGHPNNCKVTVYCKAIGGIAYPTGIACTTNQCRNSITGVCLDDCSDTVCNETVPSDFCTTPSPPTTTPAPSPYIFCTDTVALINSGPAVVTCYLNDTATFTVMNVTYTKSGASDVQQIALINDSNTINMFAMEDIVSIIMLNNIINITILNPSCENEGTFAVVTDINGDSVMDQGKFSVISKPSGDATLQLHPDQIAGLDNYRPDFLHTCEINVGYPPGEISIEMLKQGAAEFQKLNVNFHTPSDRVDNATCSITRTAPFGIFFTSDMDKATIRCSVSHDLFPNDQLVYSNNDTVSLIPIDFCKNNTEARSYYPHPTNCYSFVQCEVEITYSKPCPSGQCFGVTETNGCNFCYLATCPADVTTTPVPGSITSTSTIEENTTPDSTSAIDVFCNSSTVIWNSGPVDIVCQLNTTDFNVLNITFRASAHAIPTVISQIQSDGNNNDLIQDDGVTVSYVGQLVTISILNASCSSGDFYGLVAVDITGKAEGKAEGKLIVGRIPTDDAVLKLHPDQIVGISRNWHRHMCEADIGFPAGEIQIEILNQGETEFSVLNFNILNSNGDGDSCFTRKKIEFEIDFTAIMDKATIRCRVKSDLFPDDIDIYSNNETVSIIPSDFCKDYNDSSIPHSTNCNVYVQCLNNVPFGKPCQPNLCFGITQTAVCDFCYNAVCPSEITTTLQPESTVPVESIDVSCTDSTVLLNTGPGVIRCTVNATSFSMMNVTFKNKNGQIPTLVALIHSDGSIADTSNTDLIEVTFTPFTVTISVSNVSCIQEGYYGVIVDSGNDLTGKSEGRLTTTEKPSGTVDIILHPEQIIGLTSLRTHNVHTCSGQIGNPAGKIEVEILLDGAINFQTVDLSYSSSTNDTDNCMVTQVFKYLIAFTSGMNNATIRCKITNNEFPSVPPIYSTNSTLALVPHDFCNINYNGTNNYPNPSDPCNRYVNCVEDTLYGKGCASKECFNPVAGICDHCFNVDSCP